MWDLPRLGIELVSLASQGGFLTIGPLGKPWNSFLRYKTWDLSQPKIIQSQSRDTALVEDPRIPHSTEARRNGKKKKKKDNAQPTNCRSLEKEASLQTKLVEVMEFQMSYFRS